MLRKTCRASVSAEYVWTADRTRSPASSQKCCSSGRSTWASAAGSHAKACSVRWPTKLPMSSAGRGGRRGRSRRCGACRHQRSPGRRRSRGGSAAGSTKTSARRASRRRAVDARNPPSAGAQTRARAVTRSRPPKSSSERLRRDPRAVWGTTPTGGPSSFSDGRVPTSGTVRTPRQARWSRPRPLRRGAARARSVGRRCPSRASPRARRS